MEKIRSRQQFLESLDARCKNFRWSWSWVNHTARNVYFGASNVDENGDTQLILGFDWERNRKGRKNPAFDEAVENIKLVLDKSYSLHTFRQFQKETNAETGRVRVTGFEQDLELRYLVEKSDGWHALPIGDFDEAENWPKSKEKIVYLEGSKVPISALRIERNSRARAACLGYHGTICCICRFDFEATYGELGRKFIHVHHLKSISASDGPHIVCPEADLRPVCPNCHAMIHRNGKNRSLDEISSLLSGAAR